MSIIFFTITPLINNIYDGKTFDSCQEEVKIKRIFLLSRIKDYTKFCNYQARWFKDIDNSWFTDQQVLNTIYMYVHLSTDNNKLRLTYYICITKVETYDSVLVCAVTNKQNIKNKTKK